MSKGQQQALHNGQEWVLPGSKDWHCNELFYGAGLPATLSLYCEQERRGHVHVTWLGACLMGNGVGTPDCSGGRGMLLEAEQSRRHRHLAGLAVHQYAWTDRKLCLRFSFDGCSLTAFRPIRRRSSM
jgi:hypothetical protein